MRKELGLGVAGTAGLGAGLMFLLDPDMGARRRAILRDKLISLSRLAAWAADKTSRDLKNRVYGTIASTKSRFADEDVSDDVLVERVRSQMGRAVSHPHAIRATAEDGEITLSGEILSDELDDLVRSVFSVKGVKQVYNKLTTHKQPGEISSLQGGHTRRGSQYALLQSHWPPAVRLIAGTSGAIAAGIGAKQGGIIGSMISAAGIALAIAAITNQSLRRIMSHAAKVSEDQFAKGRERTIEFPGSQRRTGKVSVRPKTGTRTHNSQSAITLPPQNGEFGPKPEMAGEPHFALSRMQSRRNTGGPKWQSNCVITVEGGLWL